VDHGLVQDDVAECRKGFLPCILVQAGKIEVLRKPEVAEVASLQGRSTLEPENGFENGLRKHSQEPRQTVFAFEHILEVTG
jgi:hypothetical protein